MAGMPIQEERMSGPNGPAEERAPWRLLAASILLHLLLLATALLVVPERRLPVTSERTVSVEILVEPAPETAEQPAREEQPGGEPVAAPEPVPEPAEPSQARAARDGVTVRAKTMLAARALADPRSRDALHEWRKLYPDERIIQLCNLEAMEQVHAWRPAFQPDFVVAYAMADIRLSNVTLEAGGAALRDHQNWYNISYTCEVTADMEAVVAFEFVLGEQIPESEWESHFLAAGDGPED
jgi:hypothetical protein